MNIDSGLLLFGALLVLATAAATLSLLVRRLPEISRSIVGIYTIMIVLILGIVTLDLFASYASIPGRVIGNDLRSELFSTHRALLIHVPFFLTLTNMITLLVFQDRIASKQGTVYARILQSSSWIVLIFILIIALESLF